MPKPKKPIVYSIRSASVALRVSRQLLTEAVRDGRLQCRRLGVRSVILTSDIENFVRSLPEFRRSRNYRKRNTS